MKIISFISNHYTESFRTDEKPVWNIIRAVFSTNDSTWVNRLSAAKLNLDAKCYDRNDRIKFHYSFPIHFVGHISPNHRQPVFELNYFEHFNNPQGLMKVEAGDYWIASIELTGVTLNQNETFTVTVFDREHVKLRVQDWVTRINDIYNDIQNWVGNTPNLSCSNGSPVSMNEEMMKNFEVPSIQLPSLNIYRANQLVLAIKPKGLWMIAANGRIDFLSSKGSFMLVDFAENFQTPNWHVYTADKKQKSQFTQKVFEEILRFVL